MKDKTETESGAVERLEAELEARDEFFSAVAHELRNPLNALHLTLAGLMRAHNGPTPLPPEQFLTRINRASAQVLRLSKLVDDMLDVSRISSGRLKIDVEEFDAVPVLTEVVARAKDIANPSQISLTTPPSLKLKSDRIRFIQTATNLLSNAILYGSKNPIEMRLEAGRSTVRLTIEDRGIGIAEADQERIFERFQKLGQDEPNVRFGVGLWVTREVVGALHGEIRVSSKLGIGSIFVVELPMESGDADVGPPVK